MTSPFLNPPPEDSNYPRNGIKLLVRGPRQYRSLLCAQMIAIGNKTKQNKTKSCRKMQYKPTLRKPGQRGKGAGETVGEASGEETGDEQEVTMRK